MFLSILFLQNKDTNTVGGNADCGWVDGIAGNSSFCNQWAKNARNCACAACNSRPGYISGGGDEEEGNLKQRGRNKGMGGVASVLG